MWRNIKYSFICFIVCLWDNVKWNGTLFALDELTARFALLTCCGLRSIPRDACQQFPTDRCDVITANAVTRAEGNIVSLSLEPWRNKSVIYFENISVNKTLLTVLKQANFDDRFRFLNQVFLRTLKGGIETSIMNTCWYNVRQDCNFCNFFWIIEQNPQDTTCLWTLREI